VSAALRRSWRDRPVVVVAGREIRERAGRRAFWVLLVLSAAAVAAVVVIPKLVSGTSTTRVAVVDGAPAYVAPAVRAAGTAAGTPARPTPVDDAAAARRAVRSGHAGLAVLADGSLLVRTTLAEGDTGSSARLVRSVRESLRIQHGLAAAGLTPTEAAEALGATPPAIHALEHRSPDQAGRQGTALVANILLFVLLQIYGTWVLTGVTEEKSSRVVEVLLSSIRARDLLVGKLVGIGLVALLHGAVLAGTGVVAGLVTGASFLDQVDAAAVPAAVAWLVLGYAFYCCANAAAGSTVSRVEDAQGMAFPILLPILATYLVGFSVIFADSVPGFFWVLAYLPPTSPIAMALLQISGQASLWEGLLSMALCVAGIVGMARIAARIYEGSILRVGSRVPLRQALRARGLGA
jgi:ABC-2 type transport system permease protein